MTDWVDALELGAPDVVAAWRGIDAGQFISVRREVRRRAGNGTAERLAAELAALAGALTSIVATLPDGAFGLPGGEGNWTVAQAIGHDVHARSGLVLAASLAAGGRWPADAPTVVPGVPGPALVSREELIRKIAQSQRVIDRASRTIAGHETDPCSLEHPLVGRLRCGEWILFAGVHDVMHLEQLHRLATEPVA
jgi:DinB family protein